MWLTKKLAAGDGLRLTSGQVESSGGLCIQGEQRFNSPEQVFPYGFKSAAKAGQQAVMLDGYCAGMLSAPDSGLQEGEVMLYSSGGAQLVLKNDGTIVMNGQIIGPKA